MSLPRHQFSVASSSQTQTQKSLERRDKKIEVKIKTLVFEFLSSLLKVKILLKVLKVLSQNCNAMSKISEVTGRSSWFIVVS